MRPRGGRESAHRRRVGPAVAAGVRGGAQIQRELDYFEFFQFRQPGPVPPVIHDGEVLHHMVVEYHGPELERYAQQSPHTSACHVEIRRVLRKPADRDCYNRVDLRMQRCCDNGRVMPAPPHGTNAKYSDLLEWCGRGSRCRRCPPRTLTLPPHA